MTYAKPLPKPQIKTQIQLLPKPQVKTQTNVINIYHWITESQEFGLFLINLHLNKITQPINLKQDYWLTHSFRNCSDLEKAFMMTQDCHPRSTCVGDVMEMNGRYYLVMPRGFEEINPII